MSEKTEGPNKIKEDMNEDSKEICESKEEEQNGDSETITENQATNADPQKEEYIKENVNENDLDNGKDDENPTNQRDNKNEKTICNDDDMKEVKVPRIRIERYDGHKYRVVAEGLVIQGASTPRIKISPPEDETGEGDSHFKIVYKWKIIKVMPSKLNINWLIYFFLIMFSSVQTNWPNPPR